MIPKDTVYLLPAAVERVKDTIPDQDADDWLKDAIAAGDIEWAYSVWEEEQGFKLQSFISILPSAMIIEAPNLKVDWPKGTVTAQRRRRVVECSVVVSRRDLDRELANFTASRKTADLTRSEAGGAEVESATGDCLSRKEQREQETRARYKRWHESSQEIKADNKPRRPIEIARVIAKKEKATAETIKRRLNQDFPGWAG